jgi:hypothetical protein
MNILISGGTGFIGKKLAEYLMSMNHNIIVLSRNKAKISHNIRAISDVIEINNSEKIDVIINLAGAAISKRWSDSYKNELINSRINTTRNIVSLIARMDKKPQLFISASAIGYYGSRNAEFLDETSQPQDEFTHRLCKTWENEALQAEKYGLRVCITRLGVVLGKNGGALQQMLPAFKIGLGGVIGSGRQYFSWVHIDDVIGAFYFLIKNKDACGIYNLTAPNPLTNSQFTKALGAAIHRPTCLPMPEFVVKLLFGEMGETLLLKGQRVLPEKLQAVGFKFNYPEIEAALDDILK